MVRTLFLMLLVALAAFSRLIPHPMNFAPIAALALFGGAYFDRKYSFLLPFAALVASDAILGFYDEIGWVYGAFFLVHLLGWTLRTSRPVGRIAAATVGGSVVFFLVTNFGVWLAGRLYPLDLAGLANCYIAAIPFFRNTLAGDVTYVALLFGAAEFASRRIPSLASNE